MIRACARWWAACVLVLAGSQPAAAELPRIDLIGTVEIPGDLVVDGTPVGGLSGLTYDPGCDLFYAVSDDRGAIAAVRFYTMRVTAGPTPSVEVLGVTRLQGADGGPAARGDLDPEALALARDGTLYVASEGAPLAGVEPSLGRYALDGTLLGGIDLPPKFLTGGSFRHGVRNNLAFEGVAVTAGGRLILATENALLQDGPPADLEIGSPSRILTMDASSGEPLAEYLYEVDPVPDVPQPESAMRTNGVSEIVAVDEDRLLVVERAFSAGVGNRVRLYLVDLREGEDISAVDSLLDAGPGAAIPLPKALVADLADLGVRPDNIEGAAFGPELADGRRLLVLVSDNNFQPEVQSNQVLLFAVAGVAPAEYGRAEVGISDIQGRGHRSPLVGQCVSGATGIVTAILGSRSGQAFWVQDPRGDDDQLTSEGLLVTAPEGLEPVAVGDLVRLEGRVEEREWGFELPVTRLFASSIEVAARGGDLPPPVAIGAGGVVIPQPRIAEAGLATFDPQRFAADAFETLEGMRVAVRDPVVVGPTSRRGEFVVLADGGRDAELRTTRGGVRLLPDNSNPQRIVVDDALSGEAPTLAVGDAVTGTMTGVLHYTYGSYKVLMSAAPGGVVQNRRERERTELAGDATRLTMATYNVENLSAVSDEGRFEDLAGVVSDGLACPDVIALQEVQDDSGQEDDGTVSAGLTAARIIEAVEASGCPRYSWRSVDPVDGADGGQPGANIRNGFLFNPQRVEFVDRGACTAEVGVGVGAGPHLTCSPGVVGPSNPAFAPRENGDGGSRKPLVAELRFAGETVFVINLHLASKGGDDPLFGRRQPPVQRTRERRVRQTEVVAALVAALRQIDADANVVVLGDLNDFEDSPPLDVFDRVGLVDVMDLLPADDRYTYVYLGNSQVLDHILVSPELADAAAVDVVHLNAEFPASDRASDHDPVVATLSFER